MISCRRFIITSADLNDYRYMKENLELFSKEAIESVREYLISTNCLSPNEEVRFNVEPFKCWVDSSMNNNRLFLFSEALSNFARDFGSLFRMKTQNSAKISFLSKSGCNSSIYVSFLTAFYCTKRCWVIAQKRWVLYGCAISQTEWLNL